MKISKLLRQFGAVTLSAAMLCGTGFTAIGPYIGTSVPVSAEEKYGDLKYEMIDDTTVTITGYTGKGGNVTIPSTINGKSVVEIDQEAFQDCTSLKNIIIPDSVTYIGSKAFNGCTGLTSITIPNSVTYIGSQAFYSCRGLTSITIPNSVTDLGSQAFYSCTGLTGITIGNGVTYIDSGTFHGCTSLTSIVIPDSVTDIGSDAFRNCPGLTSVKIPSSVNTIDYEAFRSCTGLRSITIPDSVTKIGSYAFADCSNLRSIVIPDSVTKIGTSAFVECTRLTSVTIGNGVTAISELTFDGCTDLTSIVIPDSVTKIDRCAFFGCTNLKSIVIPDSVTYIGEYAFCNCDNLKSIEIPSSVTYIYYDAFSGCSRLTIYGTTGSYAETYADENGIPFVASVLTNTSVLSAEEIVLGQTITVNAKSNKTNCTYAVYYKKSYDTKWVTAQGYNTNNTVTIKPAKAADYDICVKVKDSAGEVVKKYFTVKVNAKLANKSTVSATEITLGKIVTVTAQATGGAGNYTYAILYKKDYDKNWTVKQGYTTNTTASIKPAKKTAYNICVKVKDKDGTIAKKYFTVTVK